MRPTTGSPRPHGNCDFFRRQDVRQVLHDRRAHSDRQRRQPTGEQAFGANAVTGLSAADSMHDAFLIRGKTTAIELAYRQRPMRHGEARKQERFARAQGGLGAIEPQQPGKTAGIFAWRSPDLGPEPGRADQELFARSEFLRGGRRGGGRVRNAVKHRPGPVLAAAGRRAARAHSRSATPPGRCSRASRARAHPAGRFGDAVQSQAQRLAKSPFAWEVSPLPA